MPSGLKSAQLLDGWSPLSTPPRSTNHAPLAGQIGEGPLTVQVRVADDRAQCPRCLEFQDEVRQLQQRLAASGQYVTYSPGPNPGLNVEHELERWLAVNPRSTAPPGSAQGGHAWPNWSVPDYASGKHAGGARCAKTTNFEHAWASR